MCNWLNKKNKLAVQKRLMHFFNASFIESAHPVSDQAKAQLDHYFQGQLKQFDPPLQLAGTKFQQRVWRALITIPYGHTISYQQLAEQVKDEQACRAVANANAANSLSIIIPCHRLIGSNGQLTGYAGGLEAKKYLLAIERRGLVNTTN